MKYVECPEIYLGKEKSLFLAGGISSCKDWQSEFVELLKNEDIAILNPRRKHFPTDNPNIDEEQIKWEYEHIMKADAVSFWFPDETNCPITLFELGKVLMMNKPIFIGINPNYSRKRDVEIQTKLVNPDIKIVYSLEQLSLQIKNWINKI